MTPPRLVALPGGGDVLGHEADVLVCSHCAAPSEESVPAGSLPASRVCSACGFGLVFAAPANLAPGPRDAFLLVDRTLQVSAVSRHAEVLLGADEVALVGQHLAEVLAPADVRLTPHALAAHVAEAAHGGVDVTEVVVRPPGEFGLRWRSRIGRCGPPTAAIILLSSR